eukprot:943610-Pelagomonas_calceolata.AAC.3
MASSSAMQPDDCSTFAAERQHSRRSSRRARSWSAGRAEERQEASIEAAVSMRSPHQCGSSTLIRPVHFVCVTALALQNGHVLRQNMACKCHTSTAPPR